MGDARKEIEVIHEHLERFRKVTLQTLGLVTDERLSWKPREDLRSFAETFMHIAQTEDFYLHGLFGDGWDMAKFARPKGEITRAKLQDKLSDTRAFTMTKLNELDPANLGSPVTVPGIPVPWPLRGWLWYVVEHEVHHKAILAVYLRKIDVTPPFFAYPLPPGLRPDIRADVM